MKIITRIKGGLGNQLFCYAVARRLALINNAELVIDDVTGFSRDYKYCRRYALNHFKIPCRKATSRERLEPFERFRRGIRKWLSQKQPFSERQYITQEGLDFDERVLTLKVKDLLYLDGLWQSELYFKDVAQNIREDLQFILPPDILNQLMAEKIQKKNAVSLHVRWFNEPGCVATHNLSLDYYQRAITMMNTKVDSPHYFLFSDSPKAANEMLKLPENQVTLVSHNQGEENAYADLWLMSKCQHFITANSTFSWWGAWLGTQKDKVVLTPNLKIDGMTAWGFKGLIPDQWVEV